MEDTLYDARIGILDTIRGILLDLADAESAPPEEQAELADQLGDVAEMILEVLAVEVTEYDEATGNLTAKMTLSPE